MVSLPGFEDKSPSEVASAINAHFSSIGCSLPALNREELPAFLPARNPPPVVTRNEMWRELSRVKVSTAAGPDNVPNKLIKVFAFELSIPATDILNSSLASGSVPSQWKQAIVVPVPKVTPTPSMDKLRPISLTPTLAKVSETFITRWMMEDMKSPLDAMQFGNRRGRSTSHYLIDMVQFILSEG